MLINHKPTNKIMKKLIFLLAVAGMFAFASCGGGAKTDAPPTDSIAAKVAADSIAAAQKVANEAAHADSVAKGLIK